MIKDIVSLSNLNIVITHPTIVKVVHEKPIPNKIPPMQNI